MPDSLRSIFLGLIPLQIIVVVALGLTLVRRTRADAAARDRLISLFLIGIAAQSFHFIEEFVTGFHCRWPELLGLSPWSAEFFVGFNVSWIAVWALSAAGLRAGIRAAIFPTWFFAIGMTANLVAPSAPGAQRRRLLPGTLDVSGGRGDWGDDARAAGGLYDGRSS